MAFKDLQKLKKINVIAKETINIAHLVVGKDIFALSKYESLVKEFGFDNVRLLSQDPILKADLLPKGPSTFHGESNINVMKSLYADAVTSEINESAIFYKDMMWKSFSGRSKSEVLKYDEEFFTTGRIEVDFSKVFSNVEMNDEFLNAVNEKAYQVKIKKINRHENGDLIVECINGTEFISEKLYMGLSPSQYLEFYEEKNELSDIFIQFCESTKTTSALFVKFELKKPITDIKETVFIPLSYTHDWGHFFGEFKEENGKFVIEFMHYMDEHMSTEEDVSRIIRLLKKSMEKIFSDFSKNKLQEFIALESEIPCLKIDDSLFEKSLEIGKGETKNLILIGVNAPIVTKQCGNYTFEYSLKNINGVVRGLIGLSAE